MSESIKNSTIKRIVKEQYLGHTFTTNDFVQFHFDARKGLLYIEDTENEQEIVLDMTQHTMEMLHKLFLYVYEDNKKGT